MNLSDVYVRRAAKIIGMDKVVAVLEREKVWDLPMQAQPEAIKVHLFSAMADEILHKKYRPKGMLKVRGWDWRSHPGLIVTADELCKELGISRTGMIELALLSYLFE